MPHTIPTRDGYIIGANVKRSRAISIVQYLVRLDRYTNLHSSDPNAIGTRSIDASWGLVSDEDKTRMLTGNYSGETCQRGR